MDDKEKFWYKVARTVVKAGVIPIIPANNTLIELLKNLITEEQAKFLLIFNKRSLNINEIKEKTDLDEESLKKMLYDLQNNGIIVSAPSRRTGIMVYSLMGPFPGIFEYTMMRGGTSEKEKKLAGIFEKLFNELSQSVQEKYDEIVPKMKDVFIPVDRVVPVEEKIEVPEEKVLPFFEASKIVDRYDTIALTHCYCRHEKDLANKPCKVSNERLNCLMFSKSAQFAIDYGFAQPITKNEAKELLKKAEEEGLVHKAFHVHSDPSREEEALCNCCKCCCGFFSLYYKGITPVHTVTTYIADVDDEKCTGCETCIEICPMEAIELIDAISEIDKDKCIGCGLCSYHCPENAIDIEKTDVRRVYVPPPKLNP
jgi:Pyruvate/2-oxoacid:ferredoxin oxidoreductase delta subunit/DNA-binding Lrp family transcriptional regulator